MHYKILCDTVLLYIKRYSIIFNNNIKKYLKKDGDKLNIQFKKGVLELCVLNMLERRVCYGYELVNEILTEQKDKIKLLEMVDDIRGLLVDLFL